METVCDDFNMMIEKFSLMDDAFMTKVFEDNIPCTELLLHVILKDDKIKVKQVRTQSKLKNLQGRDLTLDILAEKADGTQFNIEIQNDSKGAIAKRARYHLSLLDAHSLAVGKSYEQLPDNYVIFITRFDVLKGNLPLYHIKRTIEENGQQFSDGSQIIYVNNSIKNDTPLGKLMHDFSCAKPENMYYKELAERVSYFKRTKEGNEFMSDLMTEFMEKWRKKWAKEEKERLALRLLQHGMSIEEVADLTLLSENEVSKLAGKCSA